MNDFYQYHFPTGVWKEIVTVGGNNSVVNGTHHHNQAENGNNHADMAAVGGANGRNQRVFPVVGGGSNANHIIASGNVPSPRDRHAAVVHNSTFYIFGGFDGTSRVSDLHGFDVDRLVWREVPDALGDDLNHHNPLVLNDDNHRGAVAVVGVGGNARRAAAAVGFHHDNNMVDAGGGGVDGAGNNNNVNVQGWQVNRVGRENGLEVDFHQEQPPVVVHPHHHQPPSPRHSHSAVVYNDSMYVFGGYDGSYRSDFHEFDFIRCSWRPVFASGRTPRARYRATACVHEDMMILFGGHDGTRHLSGEKIGFWMHVMNCSIHSQY